MPTSFIDQKVEEFNKKFTASGNGDWVSSEDGDLYEGEKVTDFLKDSLTELLTKAMECVPEEKSTEEPIGGMRTNVLRAYGHNSCREQTLDNLSKLQTNK